MEKSCPGQEGYPPSRVNFSQRLYEKKVDPFARGKSWLSNNKSAERLALIGSIRMGQPKCLYGEKFARRVTLPSKEGDRDHLSNRANVLLLV